MPKYITSRQTLIDRLGPAYSRRQSGAGLYMMWWQCSAPPENPLGGCFARVVAEYRPTPSGLTPFEEELFENRLQPEEGWELTPCTEHAATFLDQFEAAD